MDIHLSMDRPHELSCIEISDTRDTVECPCMTSYTVHIFVSAFSMKLIYDKTRSIWVDFVGHVINASVVIDENIYHDVGRD